MRKWLIRLLGGDRNQEVMSMNRLLAESRRRLHELERRSTANVAIIEASKQEIARLREQFILDADRYEAQLTEAERTLRQYQTSLEEERSKVQVYETEITVLVAANQRHLARYDAEISIETQRQVSASMK